MKNESKIKSVILALGIIFASLIINNIIILNEKVENDGTIKNRDETTFKNLKTSSVYNGGIQIDATLTTNTTYSGNWTWAVSQPWCYDDNGVYIIEDLIINASSSPVGSGIYIKNSKNDYFIIKNCTVYNAASTTSDAGIKLENTNNGTLTNNNCSDNGNWGIFLYNYCENNTVSGNTACDNLPLDQDYGIYLFDHCDNNNISGNTVNDNSAYGIFLFNDCNNNTISGNTAGNIFTTNQNFGIYLADSCDNNNISGNDLNNNAEFGIWLNDHSSNNNVSGNTINGNLKRGIYLYNSCNNNTISGNTANDNGVYGIYIWNGCNDNNISGNTANDNSVGIRLDNGCNNNNISGNTVNDNSGFGIFLFNNCNNNTLSGNSAIDNDYCGIGLSQYCNGNNITENNANDNTQDGIYLLRSDNNTIKNNTINRNNLGIWLSESDNNTISQNILVNNRWCIFEDNCQGNIIENNDCTAPTVLEPIFIDGTATGVGAHNWTWAKNQPWCSGSGTWSDPYAIENLKISGFAEFNGIEIRNSNVSFIIQDCEIFYSNSGILLNNVNNSRLIDNNFHHSEYGILFFSCNNNTISGNTINYNEYGIYLEEESCYDNTIANNTINNNSDTGIYLTSDCNNTISGNIVNYNEYYGIYLEANCNDNTITNNVINNNGDIGIYIYRCYDNTIANNVINNNGYRGNLEGEIGESGIFLDSDNEYNEITENILYNNTWGIDIREGNNNNSIYENFFLKNGKHASDDGTDNKWNSTTIGNYWDNHTGPDKTPQDGIVDDPYTNISGSAESIDYLPIAEDGAPQITINSPSEGDAFSLVAPSFDVEITDIYVFERWYTIDSGVINYTFTENGIINQTAWDEMDDGTITLTFYTSDIIYQYFHNITHIGSASVSIIKDTVAPIIIINSPAEGYSFGNTAPLFNITVTEDNLDLVWYSFDGGLTTYAITNNTIFNQTAWTALSQGEVTITFYARDLAGNEASESVTVIKVLEKDGDEFPFLILIIAIVSTAGGIGAAIITIGILRKRKPTKEVI